MDRHADRNVPHAKTQPHTTGLYNISPFFSFTDAKHVRAADHHISSCVQTNICQSSKKQRLLIKMNCIPLKRSYLEATTAGCFHQFFTCWRETVCRPCNIKITNEILLFCKVANTGMFASVLGHKVEEKISFTSI